MARLRSFLSGTAKRDAQEVYITLVEQSRNPFFYRECAVPDTLDGRFEIILLHMFLKLYRLRSEASLSRLLLECLFDDMDRNLREMGIGDTGIGKRVKTMSKAAFGRLEAYTKAYDTKAHGDDAALRDALLRNVYRGEDVAPEALAALLDYVRKYR